MNFDQLETFLTISKVSNFSKAAEKLNVTQPAVSARISSLEDELGCKLFNTERNKRLALTKEGVLFLNYAKNLVRDMYDAKHAINLSKKPTISIGFTPNLSSQIISDTIASLNIKGSYITLKRGTSSNELVEQTLNNDVSLSFVHNPVFDPRLHYEEITTTNFVIVVNKEHKLAKVPVVTKELLDCETLICYSRRTKLWVDIEEKLKNFNVNKIETFDVDIVKSMVRNGIGFTIMPEMSLNDYDKQTLSIINWDPLHEFSIDLCAIYKKDIVHDALLFSTILSTISRVKDLILFKKLRAHS
jgi:DNA-binding transcriptional LysR family regulator